MPTINDKNLNYEIETHLIFAYALQKTFLSMIRISIMRLKRSLFSIVSILSFIYQ